MKRITMKFYFDDGAELQCVQLEHEGELHITADVRGESGRKGVYGIYFVISRSTVDNNNLKMKSMMEDLVEVYKKYTAVTLDVECAESYDKSRGYIYITPKEGSLSNVLKPFGVSWTRVK